MSIRGPQSSLESVHSSVRKPPSKTKPKPRRKPRGAAQKGPTLGQVAEKVSLIRSKIAVGETLVVYLQTHYQAIEDNDPEESVLRDDYAQVPPNHISEYIETLQEGIHELEQELIEWEAMTVVPPSAPKKLKRSQDQEDEDDD